MKNMLKTATVDMPPSCNNNNYQSEFARKEKIASGMH